jgi:hypothetical protein
VVQAWNLIRLGNTRIPQGSPVSPILFAVYISGVFDQVEQRTEATGLSFVDDISCIASGNNIKEITEILEECGKITMEWAQQNAVEFDAAKTEAILFTKKKDKRHPKIKIKLGNGKEIPYNKGATRCLGFWMDSALNFNEHFTKRMAKARQREAEIKRLHGKHGMNPCNIRTIMTATIQTTTLFGSEIWW